MSKDAPERTEDSSSPLEMHRWGLCCVRDLSSHTLEPFCGEKSEAGIRLHHRHRPVQAHGYPTGGPHRPRFQVYTSHLWCLANPWDSPRPSQHQAPSPPACRPWQQAFLRVSVLGIYPEEFELTP